jgi:hypothetical protein
MRLKEEGSSLIEPENPVRLNSFHVFLVNCIPRCLNGDSNHSHQDVVSHPGLLQFSP